MSRKLPSQIQLVAGIAGLLGNRPVNSRQFNAVISAANNILKELEVEHIPAPPGCGLQVWRNSDEVGESAKSLFILLDNPNLLDGQRINHPYDSADFLRCVTMLAAIPDVKTKLETTLASPKLIASVPKPWKQIFQAWNELEALAENPATHAQLTHRIQEIISGHQEI